MKKKSGTSRPKHAGPAPATYPPLTDAERVQKQVAAREHIRRALHQELVGPAPGLPAVQSGIGADSVAGEEILRAEDPPRVRYGAGILFPQRSEVGSQVTAGGDQAVAAEESPSIEVELGDAVDVGRDNGAATSSLATGRRSEADTEEEVNRANEHLPSAMGLTALVRLPERLRVTVSAARYREEELTGRGRHGKDGKYRPYMSWRRVPLGAVVEVSREELLASGVVTIEREVPTGRDRSRLAVHIYCRPLPGSDAAAHDRMVTITLLNRTVASASRPRDDDCFFQCGFSVQAGGGEFCFLEYPERPVGPAMRDEQTSLRLLYRKRRIFAVGHGCAPDWQGGSSGTAASGVWTEVLPMFEVPPVVPRELPGVALSMRLLSGSGNEGVRLCERLTQEYSQWIEAQWLVLRRDVPAELREAGERHLRDCESCLVRMQDGLRLLAADPLARRAFRLMNRAMLLQQEHYRVASQGIREWRSEQGSFALERPYMAPDEAASKSRWRPFQLAFILMNIPGLLNPASEDRAVVDVIWFPTGGGKTEAYLGLTALALFLRRLRQPGNAGTTVLMRYTLRLLTAQQYQRAASLICACEYLRREDPAGLGPASFTIGLWVGSIVTPNHEQDAVADLKRLQSAGGENPFIVISCPWCGARMGPVPHGNAFRTPGYHLLANPQRVRFVCEDPVCDFSKSPGGLPLMVIDEQMYGTPPSLLIGTVDKFALLPWTPEIATFFGANDSATCGPPDLIIQDELHLIAGPLGSMVGLYETAIDALCSPTPARPVKIVASTATIARAAEQVRGLYARPKAVLFPPQGLEVGNSFFAEERPDLPGRMYLGVFASGLPSQQTAMIRVLAALLQAVRTAGTDHPEILDPYWTLIAYFNSIRELGHTATLVSADIREYLAVVHERLGLSAAWQDGSADGRRFLNTRGALELTSRVSGNAISESLQALFERYQGASGQCVDICLATNMIQVGLDVPRLGLMVVAGQPKTTSEYIQATSRVGRDTPGLVIDVFNPSKPRDRSHFEHFRSYHESIYRFVEPTSVTPFAVPVRERALHALVIALVRIWGGPGLRKDPFTQLPSALVGRIVETLRRRAIQVDAAEAAKTEQQVIAILEEWQRLPASRYGGFGPQDPTTPMMYPAGAQPLPGWQLRARATPTSLRSVDAECDARTLVFYPDA